jgi:hypothetical protein
MPAGIRVSALATAAAPGTFYVIEGGVSKKIVLGTAAVRNTGTSGATVPLLNTANTWSAAQVFDLITATENSNAGAYFGRILMQNPAGTVRRMLRVRTADNALELVNQANTVITHTLGNAGELSTTGAVDTAANYRVASVQVVGARKTGWATATGTPTRTTFATGSVTLPQLAERVKALIDDLHATAGHGLIGA